MTLLTLNMHSRPEKAEEALQEIAALILRREVRVIALQEVNQSPDAPEVIRSEAAWLGAWEVEENDVSLRQDNVALRLTARLNARDAAYRFCYLPIKRGYGRYDEGVALLWRGKEQDVRTVQLSDTRDYGNWRRRMALGVRLGEDWFYSLHTSRYDDPQEPFEVQWRRLTAAITHGERTFLMGDFNCPSDGAAEGYLRMRTDGWQDTFLLAQHTRGYATVFGDIDGWEADGQPSSRRIDYILTNDTGVGVLHAETVFDPVRGERAVSDHCGVLCVLEED